MRSLWEEVGRLYQRDPVLPGITQQLQVSGLSGRIAAEVGDLSRTELAQLLKHLGVAPLARWVEEDEVRTLGEGTQALFCGSLTKLHICNSVPGGVPTSLLNRSPLPLQPPDFPEVPGQR